MHPFDDRNIHPALPPVVRTLFDDGHYSQATFEAYKFVDAVVSSQSGISDLGTSLMMAAFKGTDPSISLTPCMTLSEKNEQEGYKFLFSGAILAVRNPRGHEHLVDDGPDLCLDHLSLASLLLRRLVSGAIGLRTCDRLAASTASDTRSGPLIRRESGEPDSEVGNSWN